MKDFEPYSTDLVHRLIEPGPTILVSTFDGDRANVMTNGFNMPVRHDGVIAAVIGPWDTTFTALAETGECVIGVPGADLMERTVDIGNCSGDEVDKWQEFGLTPVPAETVGAPLIADCQANIECVVEEDSLVEDYALWVLRATAAWVRPDMPEAPEFHHRGDGTFSTNGPITDLRERMTKWRNLTQ
ncbi:flavin reductase family protein [Glycomyces tarimensis]